MSQEGTHRRVSTMLGPMPSQPLCAAIAEGLPSCPHHSASGSAPEYASLNTRMAMHHREFTRINSSPPGEPTKECQRRLTPTTEDLPLLYLAEHPFEDHGCIVLRWAQPIVPVTATTLMEKNAMSKQDHIASQNREETSGNGRSRILARQLARPLTAEEIDVVSGARRAVQGDAVAGAKFLAGGTCSAGTCCVPDCDD